MKLITILGTVLLLTAMLLAFGCERKVINEISGGLIADATTCFTCHSDQNFDLVAAENQWEHSKHASGDHIYLNRFDDHESCEKCHTNEGFLTELNGEFVDTLNFTAIGCFTCHQPHTKGSLELRTLEVVSLENGDTYDKGSSNICARCHKSRRDASTYIYDGVELSDHWGPHHSNQSDMLMGTNAYEYAGYDYDNAAHTNATINGCVDCHMSPSGSYVLGGHSLGMEFEEEELYNLTGCNSLNCHNGELEDFDYEGKQTEVEELFLELQDLLLAGNLIELVVEDGESAYVPVDERVVQSADSAGAVYNYMFIYEDQSHGVHNAEYAIGLLESSINFIQTGSPDKMAVKGD
jgi:hypothetical protein